MPQGFPPTRLGHRVLRDRAATSDAGDHGRRQDAFLSPAPRFKSSVTGLTNVPATSMVDCLGEALSFAAICS